MCPIKLQDLEDVGVVADHPCPRFADLRLRAVEPAFRFSIFFAIFLAADGDFVVANTLPLVV